MGCELCPRKCGVNRSEKTGFCGAKSEIKAARAALHFWEEPCISGKSGSGAVFFSGCVMKCVYCQNSEISAKNFGKEISVSRLAEIFLELEAQGALNINLVNPTHFVPKIKEAIEIARNKGLLLPFVYNSGGYERVETLKTLEGYIDVYLPDVKYFSDELAKKYSSAPRYFETAMEAVGEMLRQTGKPVFDESGAIIKRGVIVRHLVLPGQYRDSVEVIKRLGERFGGEILLSLMRQYTPAGEVKTGDKYGELSRRVTTFEYEKAMEAAVEAGLSGFCQERSSASEEYTPRFDLTGI